ncbi:MAG: winged helix-turn-helix domain-containing protein [Acidiferrobacteraceae bacterium]
MWFVPFFARSTISHLKASGILSLGKPAKPVETQEATILLCVEDGMASACMAILDDMGCPYRRVSDIRHIKRVASLITARVLLTQWKQDITGSTDLDPLADYLPVIVLGLPEHKAAALAWGATICLPLPLDSQDLSRSISWILGTLGTFEPPKPLLVGSRNTLQLDPNTTRVWVHDHEIPMTRRHFQLLYELATHPNEVMTLARLCTSPFGCGAITPQAINVHVCRVRKTLRNAGLPDCIETIYGIGYRFHAPWSQETPGAASADPPRCLKSKVPRLQ